MCEYACVFHVCTRARSCIHVCMGVIVCAHMDRSVCTVMSLYMCTNYIFFSPSSFIINLSFKEIMHISVHIVITKWIDISFVVMSEYYYGF